MPKLAYSVAEPQGPEDTAGYSLSPTKSHSPIPLTTLALSLLSSSLFCVRSLPSLPLSVSVCVQVRVCWFCSAILQFYASTSPDHDSRLCKLSIDLSFVSFSTFFRYELLILGFLLCYYHRLIFEIFFLLIVKICSQFATFSVMKYVFGFFLKGLDLNNVRLRVYLNVHLLLGCWEMVWKEKKQDKIFSLWFFFWGFYYMFL